MNWRTAGPKEVTQGLDLGAAQYPKSRTPPQLRPMSGVQLLAVSQPDDSGEVRNAASSSDHAKCRILIPGQQRSLGRAGNGPHTDSLKNLHGCPTHPTPVRDRPLAQANPGAADAVESVRPPSRHQVILVPLFPICLSHRESNSYVRHLIRPSRRSEWPTPPKPRLWGSAAARKVPQTRKATDRKSVWKYQARPLQPPLVVVHDAPELARRFRDQGFGERGHCLADLLIDAPILPDALAIRVNDVLGYVQGKEKVAIGSRSLAKQQQPFGAIPGCACLEVVGQSGELQERERLRKRSRRQLYDVRSMLSRGREDEVCPRYVGLVQTTGGKACGVYSIGRQHGPHDIVDRVTCHPRDPCADDRQTMLTPLAQPPLQYEFSGRRPANIGRADEQDRRLGSSS